MAAEHSTGTSGSLPVVILISGRGSNMRAIAARAAAGQLPIDIRAVVSDKEDAPGLELAAELGIETRTLPPKLFLDRAAFDTALTDTVASYEPGLVVLAGYMRILSARFIDTFPDRIVNIHPSLLPKYPGLHTHRRALEARDCQHGASVHFVTLELDGGPVIIQACVDVFANDTEASLSARVQQQEHRIYSQAIDWFARGRLELKQGYPHLDGELLSSPVFIDARGSTLHS